MGVLERLAQPRERSIVASCRANEISLELPDIGHGIFTHYLAEGLKGAADLNHDGVVTLEEIYAYVEPEVTKNSRAVGGNQHPVLKGEVEGALPLTKTP